MGDIYEHELSALSYSLDRSWILNREGIIRIPSEFASIGE
jgi:hypothetical protein